ncbi:MAG: hypothetical protein HRU19_00565 [Pseudobacteriovorax sp.]|nr:hypothetical protein [Pseudobacteriovorax sp.]
MTKLLSKETGIALLMSVTLWSCKKESRPITVESNSTQSNQIGANTGTPGATGALAMVGDGYDIFTGNPRGNCLTIPQDKITISPMNQTESTIDIVKTKRDLITRLESSLSLGVGFTGPESKYEFNADLTSKKINEMTVSTDELVAVTELVYRDRIARVNTTAPDLNTDSQSIIQDGSDYFEFRDNCGDRYVSEAVFGSRLLLVVKATAKNETNRSVDELGLNLELILNDVMAGNNNAGAPTLNLLQSTCETATTGGTTGGVSDGTIDAELNRRREACEMLEAYDFDTYCISEGSVDSSICTEFGVDFSQDDLIAEVTEKFRNARNLFAQGLDASTDTRARLSVGLSVYNQARSALKSAEPEFESRVNAVNDMFYLLEEIRSTCSLPTADSRACTEAIGELEDLIYSCSVQEEWVTNCQQVPTEDELRTKYSSILL